MSEFFDPSELAFSIFTGDIISHDNDDLLSRAYIEYEEQVTYETFKAHMGNVPIYPTLGILILSNISRSAKAHLLTQVTMILCRRHTTRRISSTRPVETFSPGIMIF